MGPAVVRSIVSTSGVYAKASLRGLAMLQVRQGKTHALRWKHGMRCTGGLLTVTRANFVPVFGLHENRHGQVQVTGA